MICKTTEFFIFTLFLLQYAADGFRHRRSQIDTEPVVQTPPCDVICEAQWKSEFQINFEKLYDTDYFEVPLDSVILSSLNSLKTFCSSTQQKYACFKRECEINGTPWSPDKHICLNHVKDFERSISCLSVTNETVQKQCSDVCTKFDTLVSPTETERMMQLKLSDQGLAAFEEQNEHCHFIACHQMCHEYVITKMCSDKTVASDARSAVKTYYDAFLQQEYVTFQKQGHGNLFSSFCRRVTPGQQENAVTKNMTRYNNRSLDRIRADIKNMLASTLA